MADRFEKYNGVLESLVSEAIACSPPTWDQGTLTIDCDGNSINYRLKNADDENKAQISGDLRSLCEKLYVAMRDGGDIWVESVVHFFKKDDSWGFKVDYRYPEKREKENSMRTSNRNPPWWKFLSPGRKNITAWNRDPESLVKEFICDYLAWNNRAHALTEGDSSESADDLIESGWRQLIQKFCLPNFKGQPIAYGSESSHAPEREKIISIDTKDDAAIIRTRVKASDPNSDFCADYEYDLIQASGRWYLEQVYYVDDEGRYPGL